jgi:uncharacterized protein (TIGR03032 family)
MHMSEKPLLALTTSRGFPDWLAERRASIAFTTYQAGKVFFLGVRPDGRLWIHERSFPRCMGLATDPGGRSLYMATQVQLYRFDNVLPPGGRDGFNDALFAPHMTWITGDIDIHDVGIGTDGRPVFVNTLFNCLATVSDGYSFRPLWRPPFISRLAAEDRCHLNGMAMENGEPRFVTAVSRSDSIDGWRDRRTDGGIVMDVADNRVVAEGLSMPHSPRLHRGEVWLVNSGTGEFGRIDKATGRFEAVAFCPGYARGLAFLGDLAVVGLSLPRETRTFQGLPLDEALRKRDLEPRCGLLVIDTHSGDTIAWVRIEGVVSELFDIVVLPGLRTPAAIGLKGEQIRRVLAIDEETAGPVAARNSRARQAAAGG